MVIQFSVRVPKPFSEEKQAFQQIILEEKDAHMQKNKLNPYLTVCTRLKMGQIYKH